MQVASVGQEQENGDPRERRWVQELKRVETAEKDNGNEMVVSLH